MREEFARSVLVSLRKKGILNSRDKILCVCSGHAEASLFDKLKFSAVTLTTIGLQCEDKGLGAINLLIEDAENLSFPALSFDYAFVSDGLHHCASPHRALLEMYRVSRKGVIVIESRDSFIMKLALRLNLSQEYEVSAVAANQGTSGGVNNSEIPNFIYRWTEREFEKTIKSYDPIGRRDFFYFYGLNLPWQPKNRGGQVFISALSKILVLLTAPFKGQRNSFALVAMRPNSQDVFPWLKYRNGTIFFDKALIKKPS